MIFKNGINGPLPKARPAMVSAFNPRQTCECYFIINSIRIIY